MPRGKSNNFKKMMQQVEIESNKNTFVPSVPSDISPDQMFNNLPINNMTEIFSLAQKVASNIQIDQNTSDPKDLDFGKIINQVTQNVSQVMTPEVIQQLSSNINIPNNSSNVTSNVSNNISNDQEDLNISKTSNISFSPVKHKKSKHKIQEYNSEDDEEHSNFTVLAPKTKDLHFTLNVTLEELYSGKVKKLGVRRKRLIINNNEKQIVEEKKKLSVVIEPGMHDEQVITFNKQADEKEGYEAGDIIITLCCTDHDEFTRDGNNLILEKEISIYEMFKPELTINLIDDSKINVSGISINMFGEEIECYRKLIGYGMPLYGSEQRGDLLILFKPVLPDKITDEQLEQLKCIFPPVNKIINDDNIPKCKMHIVSDSDFEYNSESEDSSENYEDSESDLEDSESDSEDSESDNSENSN